MPKAKLGTLYVLATPLGNLGDASARLKVTLARVSGILCEDTRRGVQLLRALEISEHKRLERLDTHCSNVEIQQRLEPLLAGEDWGLVSDAGTPGVSDPGARLVYQARRNGVLVVPVSGPSAVTTFLSVLGAETEIEEKQPQFDFWGFLPRETVGEFFKGRFREWRQSSQGVNVARWIAFESPHRVREALTQVAKVCEDVEFSGVSIRCVVAKELTKLHETFWEGTPSEVAAQVADALDQTGELGEWCLGWVLRPRSATATQDGEISDKDVAQEKQWRKWLQILIEQGVSVSRATAVIRQEFGARKSVIYALALEFEEQIRKKNSHGG